MPPSSAGDRTTTTSRATWANKPFQAHIRQTPSRIREGVFVCLSGRNRGVSRPFRTALPGSALPRRRPFCPSSRSPDALRPQTKRWSLPPERNSEKGKGSKKQKRSLFERLRISDLAHRSADPLVAGSIRVVLARIIESKIQFGCRQFLNFPHLLLLRSGIGNHNRIGFDDIGFIPDRGRTSASEARPAMNPGPGKPPPVQDAGSSQACKRSFLKSKPLLSRRGLGWLAISMTARRLFKVRVYKHSATTKQPLKVHTTKKVRPFDLTLKRRLPTLPRDDRSTIGVSELNFSVRNGKRWNLTAITT